jgi:drug/metabolite transporter (DMT)-like permease
LRLPSPTAERAVLFGVALMLVGDLMFALNDAMGKWLVATYSPGQLMLIRSFAGLVVLAPFVLASGASSLVRVERPGLQVGRVVASTVDSVLFYAAVFYLPVADVMTFYLAAPIYVAALSPFLLGETVGWRRWLAIVIGFVGVVVALNPSASTLTWPAVISLIGSIAFALAMVASRALRATPDRTLVFWQTAGGLLAGAVLAPFGWITPTLTGFCLLSLLGIVAMAAHILINRALKYAPASTLAPLQYTLLLWAIVFGYLFFGDVPAPMMLVGAAIIIASGLFIFLRERKRNAEVASRSLGKG